jgi:hypothetical protein
MIYSGDKKLKNEKKLSSDRRIVLGDEKIRGNRIILGDLRIYCPLYPLKIFLFGYIKKKFFK